MYPDDKDPVPDSTPTPAETPEARRKSSGALRPGLVQCPACKGDLRQDCDLCWNDELNSCTRWVSVDRAIAWTIGEESKP